MNGEIFRNIFDLNMKHYATDVTLIFDDGIEINTHKIILIMYSKYFQCMFNSSSENYKFNEESKNKIKLHEINSKIFDIMLSGFYKHLSSFDDLDIYECIEFYRTVSYFEISFDKNYLMNKLFRKFKSKYNLRELYEIFDIGYFFDLSEKNILFEIIYKSTPLFKNEEEIKFLDKYNITVSNRCMICKGIINTFGTFTNYHCNHLYHSYCIGDDEILCPICGK